MVISLGLLVRESERPFESFVSYYRQEHTSLGTELPALARYTTALPVDPGIGIMRRAAGDGPDLPNDETVLQFDALSEETFSDSDALRTAFETEAGDRILQDERQFMKGVYFVFGERSVHVE
jgi:hypothetical protein